MVSSFRPKLKVCIDHGLEPGELVLGLWKVQCLASKDYQFAFFTVHEIILAAGHSSLRYFSPEQGIERVAIFSSYIYLDTNSFSIYIGSM